MKHDGIGCQWGHLFAGAFCYADDLVLLAPPLSALWFMLDMCEAFAVTHRLKFSGSKPQLIRFGREPSSDCQATVSFCETQLHFVNTVTHLSHLLTYVFTIAGINPTILNSPLQFLLFFTLWCSSFPTVSQGSF